MNEPVYRTILLFDVEGSGLRDDVEKRVVRRTLYEVVHAALSSAGVERTRYRTEDRGDGVFLLVDPSVSKPRLLHALLHSLPEDLADRNRVASPGARVRLRTVLHGGEVTLDEHGALGRDLDAAFRLLDGAELRAVLAGSPSAAAVCVSAAVHDGVVRHGHRGIDPAAFRQVSVAAKEGPLTAWVHDPSGVLGDVPGTARTGGGRDPQGPQAVPAGTPGPPETPGAPETARPEVPHTVGGNWVNGAGAGGDVVGGDKTTTTHHHYGRG
ncbi:hypothetical protein ACFV1B_09315 [Streptomyces sp. NPDC059637]|uniref:hypothetical protein n=1 Tax=Streptomyces sp. NPDC059637 TaxID=3347752 RepID=UPI0036C35E34